MLLSKRALSFQFLIGTLKTFIIYPHKEAVVVFQFLIGTLKTSQVSCDLLLIISYMFQFLIGTLKTPSALQ